MAEKVELFVVQRKRRGARVWHCVVDALGNPLHSTKNEAIEMEAECLDAEPCRTRIVRILGEVVDG